MNNLKSECTSGSESGWTKYLNSSSISSNPCNKSGHDHLVNEEEEDLSMISDASSGPPNSYENENNINTKNGYLCSSASSSIAKSMRNNNNKRQKHSSPLDDTANSPVFNFIKNPKNQASFGDYLEFSQDFTADNFKVKSTSMPREQSIAEPVKLTETVA